MDGGQYNGMVALTLSGADQNEACNDTFYGCVNSSGQFQISIPDDCCIEYVETVTCDECDEGKTPRYITLFFQDVAACADCLGDGGGYSALGINQFSMNGKVVLERTGVCSWSKLVPTDSALFFTRRGFLNTICTGSYGDTSKLGIYYLVRYDSFNEIRVSVYPPYDTNYMGFYGHGPRVDGSCIESGSILNEHVCTNTANTHTGGTVTIAEGLA